MKPIKDWDFINLVIIFIIFNVVILNGILCIVDNDSSVLEETRGALLNEPADADSWSYMFTALESFQSGKDPTIYQTIFFEQNWKFQYPPTSLLFIEVAEWLIGDDRLTLQSFLNQISWICVVGTVIFTIMIFIDGIKTYVPEEYPSKKWVIILTGFVLSFTFYPIIRAYELGQIQTWLNFLFALSLWLWLRGRKGESGFCFGLVSVIKPQMGLFLIWGLIRRYWKFCIMFLVVAAGFLIISISQYGLPAHFKYLEVLSYIAERGEGFHHNQSINGLINRLLFNGNNVEFIARQFAPENEIVRIVTLLTSIVLILGVLFFKFKLPESESWLGFVTAGLVFTIASPIAWEHHYGILLPIYALVFPKAWSLREQWGGGLIWVGISYILTSNIFEFTNSTAATHWNFVQSYVFFGALVLLGILIKLQIITEKNRLETI